MPHLQLDSFSDVIRCIAVRHQGLDEIHFPEWADPKWMGALIRSRVSSIPHEYAYLAEDALKVLVLIRVEDNRLDIFSVVRIRQVRELEVTHRLSDVRQSDLLDDAVRNVDLPRSPILELYTSN